jgi:hypothetical protein
MPGQSVDLLRAATRTLVDPIREQADRKPLEEVGAHNLLPPARCNRHV